jgi:UDPglucose 6-dehydrogenase
LGAKVKAYDPIISGGSHMPAQLADVNLVDNPQSLAEDSDALVLMTEWSEFQQLDYPELARLMRSPLAIDCRNFLSPTDLRSAGFHYIGIGC